MISYLKNWFKILLFRNQKVIFSKYININLLIGRKIDMVLKA